MHLLKYGYPRWCNYINDNNYYDRESPETAMRNSVLQRVLKWSFNWIEVSIIAMFLCQKKK